MFNDYIAKSRQLLAVLALGLAGLGARSGLASHSSRICGPATASSAVIRWLLIAASSIAIFTTIGIVLSVLFEAIRFFQQGADHRVPVRH